ncbi:nucleotide-binding universal stress UspA family protein [Streptacidiphilus sp. MAP12-33]|uniref:universal stress protein n=1 Tax=Streptacidiphilus sp. MAP12-33 TaxID=3156266 RepID=UPI0035194C29
MEDERMSARRIVVGVDGSGPSKAALLWAVREAELTDGTVEAITTWDYPSAWYGWTPPQSEAYDFEKIANQILADTVDEVVGPDPPARIRTRVAHGDAATVLLDAARGARLLVVGNRGHGRFAGALLGSVGQHCVQHAPCPVLVVRGSDDGTVD